ncbi:hypothetical protein GJAV_G00092810 [Gymnothorax javanicus]|nr:hypothetical protein GJAV_G00092810 [Gymnothorax javanicus]
MSRVNVDQEYAALSECGYARPTEAMNDIRNVTAAFRELYPYVDLYRFSDGISRKLVNLSGTIPVWYEGKMYDIPIRIWLHDTHPQSPPQCFLRPSSTMVINQNCSVVDASGKVLLKCLSNWEQGRSSISAVVEEMRTAFQKETPLFATGPYQAQTPPPATPLKSPLPPGTHPPLQLVHSYPPRQPYAQSPSTQQGRAARFGASPLSTPQGARAWTPPTATKHSHPDPSTERRVRRSYTEELLDLGITFGAPVSHSYPSTNPFVQTSPATVANVTSGNTVDVENLFKSLRIDRVSNLNQLNSNSKELIRLHTTVDFSLGHTEVEEIQNANGDSDCGSSTSEGASSLMWDGDGAGVLPSPGQGLADPCQMIHVTQLPLGIPPQTMRNKLTIHFQRRRNGGGDVLDVVYPTARPDQACIVFHDPQVAQRVVSQAGHVFSVNQQQFPVEVKRVDNVLTQVPVPDGVPREKSHMFQSLVSMEGRSFTQEDVLEAVQSCRDLPSALRYLSHECPICREQRSFSKMITMTHCPCAFCEGCFKAYFSSVIKEKSIECVVCPLCSRPDVREPGRMEESMDYFNLLDTQIRHYLDPQTHELFQRKLRDRALQEMPNFRWCAHCSFGLLHEANRLRMDCPSCKKSTCSSCKSPWVSQHEGLSCEMFRKWQTENNPEYQNSRLEHLLSRNKIDCPRCRFRFFLSKGGCLHFKCTQCQYEFCGGCKRAFKLARDCNFSVECRKRGLHAHHPRDCLYHLRDWSVLRLRQLLLHHSVPVPIPATETGSAQEWPLTGVCGVLEQRDISQKEEPCGRPAPAEYGSYCEQHYKECLVELINQKQLDPAALYDRAELVSELQRWRVQVPLEHSQEHEPEYLQRLRQKVRQIGLVAERPLVEKVAVSASCPTLGDQWSTAQSNPTRGIPRTPSYCCYSPTEVNWAGPSAAGPTLTPPNLSSHAAESQACCSRSPNKLWKIQAQKV